MTAPKNDYLLRSAGVEMTAKEQGLYKLETVVRWLADPSKAARGSLRGVPAIEYVAKQALAALASDTGERGVVDCIGLALDLEQQAERGVASQTAERAMRAAATGLRSLAALRAQPAGGGEDWQARALAAEADIERMTDAFNRENGPTFMGEPVLPPEKMVELEPGVKVPLWLLDHARRVELYMKAHLPGPWRIGGIQSYDYKKEIGHE